MSFTYITQCPSCCSGTNGCPVFSGCVGFPRVYNFLASGFIDCVGNINMSGLNGQWPMTMPAPVNPYLCSWINSGSVANTEPTWILSTTNRTLNCPVANMGSGGSNHSGAFNLFAISPAGAFRYVGYLSSGCLLSGSWNCSGPNTLYFDPYDPAAQYNAVILFCSGGVPPSLTVTPSFV